MLNVVHALDVENAGNAFYTVEDAFELLAIINIKCDFNASSHTLAAAFERTDIRAGLADHRGDAREHSRAIFGEDTQTHRKVAAVSLAHSTGMRRSVS